MISAALKLLAPYLVGAFIVVALGAGTTIWFLHKSANKAKAELLRQGLVVAELEQRVIDANNNIDLEKASSKTMADEYTRQIKELEDDIASRSASLMVTANDLSEANAVIERLLKEGDDETKRFLGPLPGPIIDFLREPSIGMPGKANGDADSGEAASGFPFTGYAGANIDSD